MGARGLAVEESAHAEAPGGPPGRERQSSQYRYLVRYASGLSSRDGGDLPLGPGQVLGR